MLLFLLSFLRSAFALFAKLDLGMVIVVGCCKVGSAMFIMFVRVKLDFTCVSTHLVATPSLHDCGVNHMISVCNATNVSSSAIRNKIIDLLRYHKTSPKPMEQFSCV